MTPRNPDPPASGTVEHTEDCSSPEVVEHDTARRRHLVCRTCGAHVTLERVERWTEATR